MSKWNLDCELNGGELSTCRRPNRKFGRDGHFFLSCAKCGGSYTSKTLTRHFNKCTNNLMKGEMKVERVAQQLGRAFESRLHCNSSEDLSQVFSKIRVNNSNAYVREIREIIWLADNNVWKRTMHEFIRLSINMDTSVVNWEPLQNFWKHQSRFWPKYLTLHHCTTFDTATPLSKLYVKWQNLMSERNYSVALEQLRLQLPL